ncbi:hypothetical protein [Xanthomonas arboricola]|uniref:hypothetical protein n=1 Tax=Xanthomonas arboricola TaxID=56448 RepID=UPI000E1E45EF|nr:hypothetical protein [Xanthomonas arboricola]
MRAGQRKTWLLTMSAASVALLLSTGAVAQDSANAALPVLDAKIGRLVADQIEPDLQRFVDQQPRLHNQAKHVLVRVTPDPTTGIVWIDLDAGYLPKDSTEFLEDFGEAVRAIENEGYELVGDIVRFKYIKVRIGGRDLNQIYPPEYLKKK